MADLLTQLRALDDIAVEDLLADSYVANLDPAAFVEGLQVVLDKLTGEVET